MKKQSQKMADNQRCGGLRDRNGQVSAEEASSLPRIPKKYRHLIFGVIQSGLTCAIAAAIASFPFYAEGTFASHWAHTYLYSWTLMLPVVVIAAPFIRRIVESITR